MLFDKLDIQKITLEQAELNKVENVLRLIGKQSRYNTEKKLLLQKELISQLLQRNFNKNNKVADILCGKLGIPVEDYPALVE